MNRRLLPFLYGKKRLSLPWYLAEGLTLLDIMGAYAFRGAVSQAASYTPIAGSMGNLTAPVAPTWNATDGIICNGSTQYLATPEITITDEMTVIVRFELIGFTYGFVLSHTHSINPTQYFINPYNNEGVGLSFGIGDTNGALVLEALADVVLAMNKNGVWINGAFVADSALTPAPSAFTISGVMAIGAEYFTNDDTEEVTIREFIAAKIKHLALYGVTLTAAQIAEISPKMAAL